MFGHIGKTSIVANTQKRPVTAGIKQLHRRFTGYLRVVSKKYNKLP